MMNRSCRRFLGLRLPRKRSGQGVGGVGVEIGAQLVTGDLAFRGYLYIKHPLGGHSGIKPLINGLRTHVQSPRQGRLTTHNRYGFFNR